MPPSPLASSFVFVQHLNPMKGQPEWVMQPDDYDYQQEVARAAFADMLHDEERNKLYYEGLKAAISVLRSRGERVHVLDIGTGTGLLSMMAVRLGADSVTAVEEFRPMADCATRVMADNEMNNHINLIRKRSTEVRVGPGQDMTHRANLLVTEVFDTELIGEGAISTFNHAHKELLTTDCLVVPSSATMFAQVISSDLVSRWDHLHHIPMDVKGENSLLVDPVDSRGSSSLALHDLQLSQLQANQFLKVTDPLPIFSFDFAAHETPIHVKEQTVTAATALSSATCDAIFVWWDLHMDPDKKLLLSCAPWWAHPRGKEQPWRDHWMQAIYYPNTNLPVAQGQELSVISNHNEYSLWFDISGDVKRANNTCPMPHPVSGLCAAVSRTRLGQLNDWSRNLTLVTALRKAILQSPSPPICLCLSDQSLLPLLAAKLGAGKVIVAEKNSHIIRSLERTAAQNRLTDKLKIVPKFPGDLCAADVGEAKIDLVFGEPSFSTSLLPWHNLLFWYLCKNNLVDVFNKSTRTLPCKAELWAVAVNFTNLWKIRAPVYEVEGFCMDSFDKIIQDAIRVSDASVEPHPLWEYPCIAKSHSTMLMEFDFNDDLPSEEVVSNEIFDIKSFTGNTNGVAIWMVWKLDEDITISNGPVSDVQPGHLIEWDMHSKQGVFFFPNPNRCQKGVSKVNCTTTFSPTSGEILFSFSI